LSFDSFGLKEEILQAIKEWNFDTPTEIQSKVIPFLLSKGKDLVGLAQTGTGKTAAFGLPLVHFASDTERHPRGLILAPTRELCVQIAGDLKQFAKYLPGVRIVPVYGGTSVSGQIQDISRGCQIVVATPGRLLDLIKRNRINVSDIEHLVLDEADIMLNMGFKEELDAILQETPDSKNVLLLSATMPDDVARIAREYMHQPETFVVGRENSGAAGIEHSYYMVHTRDKYPALKRLLDFNPDIYGIVFCRTKISTQEIADKLIKDGYPAEAIHSDLSQFQRDSVMAGFRSRHFQILVATDVAARGIDVSDLTHIIHYDLPDENANYIHRSGRTGRAGRSGVSLAIINMKEKYKIRQIEHTLGTRITEAQVPLGKEICARQLLHLIDRVHAVNVEEEQILPYMSLIEEKLAALDREELLKHFVSMEFNRFLTYYKDAPDLTPVRREKAPGKGVSNAVTSRRYEAGRGGFATLQINLGRKDHVLPPDLIHLINSQSRERKITIGKIDIDRNWSLVQIESGEADRLADRLNRASFRGRPVQAYRENRTRNYRKPSRER